MGATFDTSTLLLDLAIARLRDRWWDDGVRQPALEEIRAALAGDDDASLPWRLAGTVTADARMLRIARHASSVLDGFAVLLEEHPVYGTVAARGYASSHITIDADGFRRTTGPDGTVTRASLEAAHSHGATPVLVAGNSTSWGVGASDDRAHVASAINGAYASRGAVAFNASVKGSTVVQQAAVVHALLPERGTAVVVAGALDLIYALAWPRDEWGSLPYWRAADPDLTQHGDWHLTPGAYDGDPACDEIRRALRTIGSIARARHARVLFLSQPHLDFAEKVTTPRERALATALSVDVGAFRPVHAGAVLRPHAAPFARWLEAQCASAGIDWIDANRDPVFTGGDDVFLDHIHVNDAGHRRMADIAAGWALAG